jgi:uncharacterized membrane protein
MFKLQVICILLSACSSSPETGASCPPGTPPTYASFGRAFFARYCTGCHSRNAASRFGAPREQNFDTEDDIRAHAIAIDSEAASGPDATNTDMPDMTGPVQSPPTQHERELLGQFLACERRPDSR